MFGSYPLAYRPLVSAARAPRPFTVAAVQGEYGWAAWSYSRQAKLNAWGWHGIGPLGNVNSWATLGNALYLRGESDNLLYVMQPDTFYEAADANVESTSVLVQTQWLDFGKPARLKALTGIDADCKNVSAIEIYVSTDGSRAGVLSESVNIGDNQGGWTYSGEVIPLSSTGTEFMIKLIGDANQEVQISRLTLYYDELEG